MRNYIILNGKNSNEINGLLIQELPPISKPLIRTEVEEIDGRDGDIVTPLGYSAYDKEFTIGLYKDFDVNEVAAYFNSEGTVIFSNEPDKYYYYQITAQIDFERLVRYRTATVTMHCQPFKYSATEQPITEDVSGTVSDEGTNLALENTAEAPFNTLDLKGNTVQNGTPTPSAPVVVQTVTGENVVEITGKNLFGSSLSYIKSINTSGSWSGNSYTNVGVTWTVYENSDGAIDRIEATGEATQSGVVFIMNKLTGDEFYSEFSTTDTYALSGCPSGGSGYYVRVASTPWKNMMTDYGNGATGTLEPVSDVQDVLFSLCVDPPAGQVNKLTFRPQLEKGSTATAYEPHQEQSYEVNLGSTELCKLTNGTTTYQDYIYKSGSDWYVHKETGKALLGNYANTVTRGSTNTSGKYRFRLTISGVLSADGTGTVVPSYCSHLSAGTVGNTYTARQCIAVDVGTNGYVFMFTTDTEAMSLDDFKTWLTGKNMSFYYPLATPTNTKITNSSLVEQLDAIDNQAHAYKGRTHINALAATGNVPHIIAAEVGEDNESTITNAGNYLSKPKITVYGSGDISLYINDMHVLQITLGDEGYITIDTAQMEAYKDTLDNLKNRLVIGDYSNVRLKPGANKIHFTGTVTKYVVENYSRWL